MSDFATLEEVLALSGATYTTAQQERIDVLLPLVSDALRVEAKKVGRDLDAMIEADETYGSVVKLVTVDVVVRALSLKSDDEPMTQESQGALGYTWSGTYAIPGGRQRYGVIEWYGGDDDE